jgi:hypothetical protein
VQACFSVDDGPLGCSGTVFDAGAATVLIGVVALVLYGLV